MRLFEVVDALDFPVLEVGGQHLALHLVDRGQGIILLQVEHGARSAQRVEPLQGVGRIEEGHHLRTPDLVEADGVFLDGDEGVGEQVGFLHPAVLHHDHDAVGDVLAVAFVPDDGVQVEQRQRVEVRIEE